MELKRGLLSQEGERSVSQVERGGILASALAGKTKEEGRFAGFQGVCFENVRQLSSGGRKQEAQIQIEFFVVLTNLLRRK